MPRLLIIGQENEALADLYAGLTPHGFACSIASYDEGVTECLARQSPHLVLVEIDEHLPNARIWELIRNMKRESSLPIIALITSEMLDNDDGHLEMTDDFVIKPYHLRELELRIKRLLQKSGRAEGGEVIRCDDLIIDVDKCEVSVGNRLVMLTFMEYELLKFLSSNKGRVFTREILLNKVWSHYYYGGDRTVDVHIRRLRSKLEDSTHTFIETMRNIGYKFRENN